MPIKRQFSTRWGLPYPIPGAGAKCRQTLPGSFCPLKSMILEGYTEELAQNGGEDPSDIAFTPEASILPSHIVVPVDGTATFDTGQPFEWSEVTLARGYRLTIGTVFGADDVHDTGEIHVTRRFVSNLPLGVLLYGRLQTKISGQWYATDFAFTVRANTVSAAIQIDSALWATDFVRDRKS